MYPIGGSTPSQVSLLCRLGCSSLCLSWLGTQGVLRNAPSETLALLDLQHSYPGGTSNRDVSSLLVTKPPALGSDLVPFHRPREADRLLFYHAGLPRAPQDRSRWMGHEPQAKKLAPITDWPEHSKLQERPSFCFYKVDLPAIGILQQSPALHLPV